MRKQLLLLAALLMIGLGATAQKKKSQIPVTSSIRCMLWVSITRRTSSIPAMMPVRMITSISLLRMEWYEIYQ